jgi:CRP/FNR family transcriptional regulator
MPVSGQKLSSGKLSSRRLKPAPFVPSTFKTFEQLGVQVAYPAGALLFEEGKPAEGIYLVLSGQIKLTATAVEGRSMILRIAQPGEVLGLSAILNGTGNEVTAKALTPCNLIHIDHDSFMEFFEGTTNAGWHALLALARDHREVFQCARRLALFPLASARIAQVLIGFAQTDPAAKPSSSFLMVLSHAELASLVGTSRETVTRFLNELERKHIIARDDANVTILQLAKLEKLAH